MDDLVTIRPAAPAHPDPRASCGDVSAAAPAGGVGPGGVGSGGVAPAGDGSAGGAWLDRARAARGAWASLPIGERLAVIGRARVLLASDPLRTARDALGDRRPAADTIAAEILPLLEAGRFLERRASAILARTRHGRALRPAWLAGVSAETLRVPWGTVLILGPSNYPLLLPGVQALQALAAGNAVVIKPGRGGGAAASVLARVLAEAGLPEGLLQVADEADATGASLSRAPFDRIVLTGSAPTGRAVLAEAAKRLVPCDVELSGADAAFVLPGADLRLVAASLAYGLRLNGGATCIAPRRVFVPVRDARRLEARLARHLDAIVPVPVDAATASRAAALASRALAAGARLHGSAPGPSDRSMRPMVLCDVPARADLLGPDGVAQDLFAPWLALIPVASTAQALALDALSPLALGASVWGPRRAAASVATRLRVGAVTVNDAIMPTGDPRLGFGGTGDSGFGATRGPEGLLAMTRLQTVSTRGRRSFRPHLRFPRPRDDATMAGLAMLLHGGPARRRTALRHLLGRAP